MSRTPALDCAVESPRRKSHVRLRQVLQPARRYFRRPSSERPSCERFTLVALPLSTVNTIRSDGSSPAQNVWLPAGMS